jgi:hypothetical protein
MEIPLNRSIIIRLLASIPLALTIASCGKVAFSNGTSSVSTTTIPPISCTVGIDGPQVTRVYPTSCLTDPGLPQTASGFEMNNLEGTHITLNSDNGVTGTQNGVYLYIEIATYVEPDTIVINATSTTGDITELLYICNYSTDTVADPRKPQGKERTYSDAILQFQVFLPVGTASLSVSVDENTPYNSGSPTYIGIWNLNEFSNSMGTIPTSGLGLNPTYNFRPNLPVLTKYNDQLDPNNPHYPNYCPGSP